MPPEMSAPVIIVPPILFFVLSSIGQFTHGVSYATLVNHTGTSLYFVTGSLMAEVEQGL
jgi:hypothetical protein